MASSSKRENVDWTLKWDLSEEEMKTKIASFQEKLQGDLAPYVSNEDMNKVQDAKREFETDTDNESRLENFLSPLSVVVENTEERFNREQNAVKNLNQLIEEIRGHLADKDTKNWRAPLTETQKLQLKLHLKTTESWLNEQLRKHHLKQQPQPAQTLDAIVDEIEEMYQNLYRLYHNGTEQEPQSQKNDNTMDQIMSCLQKLDGQLKDCLSQEDAMRVQSAKEQLAIHENSPRSLLDLLSGIVSTTERRWNRMNDAVSALEKLLEKIRDEQKEEASLAQATDLQIILKTTEPWLSEKTRSLQQPHSAEDIEKIIAELEEMRKDLNRSYQEKLKPLPSSQQQPPPAETTSSPPHSPKYPGGPTGQAARFWSHLRTMRF
ncbi:unnamed protein product [Calicophoron daubneyi]|uniref:Dystrophin n=1 Tax=Calicophoron daubneyi TaxID=300641 RepID=A0AAV2SWW0_CALDB